MLGVCCEGSGGVYVVLCVAVALMFMVCVGGNQSVISDRRRKHMKISNIFRVMDVG